MALAGAGEFPMAKLKDLGKNTVKSVNTTGPMLVSNKFVEDSNEGVAIYVQPPAKRIVRITSAGNDGEYGNYDYDGDYLQDHHSYKGNFFLSFPHVVFRVHYKSFGNRGYMPTDLRVAFANKMKPSRLFIPPLFNITNDLSVCITLPNKYFLTLEECVKESVKAFWRTEFVDSMFDAHESHYDRKSLMGDARKWQKKTKKNPNWVPNGKSLEEFPVRFGKFASVAHIRDGQDDEDAFNADY